MTDYYGTAASEEYLGYLGQQYSVYRSLTFGGRRYVGEANRDSFYYAGDGNDTLYPLNGSTSEKLSAMTWSFRGEGGDDRIVYNDAFTGEREVIFRGGDGVDTMQIEGKFNSQISVTNSGTGVDAYTFISFNNSEESRIYVYSDVERLTIHGSQQPDSLGGLSGGDWLDGKGGLDLFKGSSGDDGYVFDTLGEQVIGEEIGGGIDTIWATVSVDLQKSANVENLRLQSGDINGTGNALANTITGSSGNNLIAGGAGNDQLYGKGGNDTFAFAEMGKANRDTIFDFNDGDRIQLSKAAFNGLDADNDGVLDMGALSLTGKAVGTGAQLIYSGSTGILSYDADGTGAGAAQDIAVIGRKLGFLDHTDILIA